MSLSSNAACPRCHQQAPIRFEGVQSVCTACQNPRSMFHGTRLDLAGTPQKVGGMAARIAGWVGLAAGSLASVTVGGLIAMIGQWLNQNPNPGYVIGGVMWVCTLGLSAAAILGGRKLSAAGTDARRAKQMEALRALARHHNGVVRVTDAATSLGVTATEADMVLTQLAQSPTENILVDIDDDGSLLYLFEGGREFREASRWQRIEREQKLRVDIPPKEDVAATMAAEDEALEAGDVPRRQGQV